MEVHHHSHSSPTSGVTARKKWTHYFWEFLMLFLAVFCGFLAEYTLEHKIEKDRIRKYMKDMIADLLDDTTYINTRFVYTAETVKVLDSFKHNLYSDSAFDNIPILYTQYSNYSRLLTANFNDQTITQLRSAGNLRLIDNEEIVAKLSEYWRGINELKTIAERVEHRYDASQEMAFRIFNRKYFYTHGSLDSLQKDFRLSESISHLGPMLLMTKEKNDLITFANIIDRVKGSIVRFRQGLLIQKRLAISLIILIREEYHLK